MRQYHELLEHVLQHGEERPDRTGTGIRSVFGHQSRYDLSDRFPLLTSKRVHVRSVVAELLWFVSGKTNIDDLHQNGCTIWDEWADNKGDLGPVYGKQWRSWQGQDGETIDQIDNLISEIRENPHSRRLVVSAWNVGDLDKMALPPCHLLFQFYISQGRLSCQLYQRSADLFLGVPFNIASYALLTHMIAHVCDLEVGEFIHTIGDAHIYNNHVSQVDQLLSRTPPELPMLKINRARQSIDDFEFDDFSFENYTPLSAIKAPVAV